MFILFLIGILIGIYLKESYQIPPMKPLLDKLFERPNKIEMNEEEPTVEKEKESSD
jgi:hypothetical protein|tara:strand:+ start:429 stop:596 length:168 start_codon:yes stop_codon:yes gene_type:complete